MSELEYFPVAIGEYREHQALDVEAEVAEVLALLAEFGAEPVSWTVPMAERTRDAVDARMARWCTPSSSTNTFLYWVGHGWSDDVDAGLAHAASPRVLTRGAVKPGDFAAWLAEREGSRHAAGTWAIVVVEACRSGRFVELVSSLTDGDPRGARRVLLIGVTGGGSDDGATHLGDFRRALARALRYDFPANDAIRLRDLAGALEETLGEAVVRPMRIQGATLSRRTSAPAGLPVDVAEEIRAALEGLSDAERLHFVPKAQGGEAQGGELGEVAWYFESRDAERERVYAWLREATTGMFVVTGRPGSGKSAFLGDLLVHSRPGLRDVLVRRGLVAGLPASVRPPDDVFDAVLHLTGATPEDVATRVEELAAGRERLTLLVDALDEALEPLAIARNVLRPLASRPGVRLLVGTRDSTTAGPDTPGPPDLLDALASPRDHVLTLTTDTAAVHRYVRRRLAATLPADAEELARRVAGTGNDFLYARLAVHEIQAGLRGDALDALLTRDYRALFAHAVGRLAARRRAFGPLLEALGLAQGRGLPKIDSVWATVAGALHDAAEPPITDDDITGLIQAASPYLMYDVEHGQTVYRLAHATFAEYFARPEPDDRQTRITEALLRHEAPNPYLVFHLAGHAAGGGPHAWRILAGHPHALDRLDPLSTASQALRSSFGAYALPPEVAGLVGTQHRSGQDATGHHRQGIRQLGAARYGGLTRPAPADTPGTDSWWSVRWARAVPYASHLGLAGHAGPINAVTSLPAGGRTLLVSAGDDGTVRFWDLATGVQAADPLPHPAPVMALATVNGPALLASGDAEGTVRIWDPVTGTLRHAFPAGDHDDPVRALVPFVTGGRLLLAALSDVDVRVWDPVSGGKESEFEHGHWSLTGFAVVTGADGRALLAMGGRYGTIGFSDLLTGAPAGEIEGGFGTEGIAALAAFTDQRGHQALAIHQHRGIKIWDLTEGGLVAARFGDSLTIRSFAHFAGADGYPWLASVGTDSSIGIWNLAERVQTVIETENLGLKDVTAFTGPRGDTLLATGGEDGLLRIWDLRHTETVDHSRHRPYQGITSLAVFRDDDAMTTWVAAASSDHTVRIWDGADGTRRGVLSGHDFSVTAVTVLRGQDGRTLLATTSEDNTVRLWDPADLRQKIKLGEAGSGPFDTTTRIGSALAVLPGGTSLAVGCKGGPIRVWNHAGGTEEAVLRGHRGVVSALVTFPGPRGRTLLASGCYDATIRIWDPRARIRRERTVLSGHEGHIYTLVTFTGPSGALLASGGADGSLRLWDPVEGKPIGVLTGHTAIRSIAVLPATDGRSLLVTSGDDTVRIWDPAIRACRVTLPVGMTGKLVVAGSALVIGDYRDLVVVDLDLAKMGL